MPTAVGMPAGHYDMLVSHSPPVFSHSPPAGFLSDYGTNGRYRLWPGKPTSIFLLGDRPRPPTPNYNECR
ncbi:hypothetical protein Bhyg_14838 [Pseudolycoriella hygida]|uniref:Uncharacterized protein n=1 Tax=Pseudolycoriella hygida TaxID=35572 RepID=A0A9Q0RW02_9DIPT|nr:hypothetical protein Bhyg_14838 [Pseudolycoriella hygida]